MGSRKFSLGGLCTTGTCVAVSLATLAFSQAASVVARNDSELHPITLAGGVLVPNGTGFVALGTFTISDAQISAAPSSPTGRDQLSGDFIGLGSSASFGVGGEGGLFSSSFVAPINGGDPLDGESIFIVAGNGGSIASSDQLWVFKSGELFGTDPFNAELELDAELATGAVLIGSPVNVLVPSAGRNFEGSEMALMIPEPGSMALIAFGTIALLRRRRA